MTPPTVNDACTVADLSLKHNLSPDEVAAVGRVLAAVRGLQAENTRLKLRVLTAAGDDLCRLTQEEIKDLSSGAVKIPPEGEFLASCKRFHEQIASTSGVLDNCLTLAQMVAENERLQTALDAARTAYERVRTLPLREQKLQRDYPTGTVNAEDAWSDWDKEKDRAWAELDLALVAVPPKGAG